MAKKFYYHHKKTDDAQTVASTESKTDVLDAQLPANRQQNNKSEKITGQKSVYNSDKPANQHQKSNADKSASQNQRINADKTANKQRNNDKLNGQQTKYSAEKLALGLNQLSLSESTGELLAKNKINTAADIIRRTEKDMYKIQGLNKKVLLEIKNSLSKEGLALREETKPSANLQEKFDGRRQSSAESVKTDTRQNRDFGRKDKLDTGAEGGYRSEKNSRNDRNNDRNNRRADRIGGDRNNGRSFEREVPHKLTAPLPVEEWRKIQKGGKWGFYDGFNTVVPAMYDEVFTFKEGLASVELDEKCGYIDCMNSIVIPFEYDTAMSFSEGYACVVKGTKCGYINKNNEVIIPFEYDAATPFEQGESKVKKDGRWGTLTVDGSVKWI